MKARYKFLIKTGSGTNTGTNVPVYFKLYGSAGTWEQTEIKHGKKTAQPSGLKFPPDSLVEINMIGPLIGDLRRLKLWHNSKSIKDAWYVDYVEITCYQLKQTWRFVCDQWLSEHRAPNFSNSVMLGLRNNIFDSEKIKNRTEYILLIKTSHNKPLIGDDVIVQFQLVGSQGQTPVFNLLTQFVQLFEPSQLDCFLIASGLDLGIPEKLR